MAKHAKMPAVDVIEARIRELTDEIKDYETIAARADDLEQMAACVAAKKTATMLRSERASHRAELRGMEITDPLERVRFMGQRAGAAGSYVANKDFYREEKQLSDERRAEEERKAKEARATRSTEEVVATLIQKLRTMPEGTQAQIRAGLGWD